MEKFERFVSIVLFGCLAILSIAFTLFVVWMFLVLALGL